MLKSPFRTVVLIILLAFAYRECHAEYLDLRGGAITDKVMCHSTQGKLTACVAVLFKEKTYHILHDQKGELEIFLIEGGKAIFIWSRDSV